MIQADPVYQLGWLDGSIPYFINVNPGNALTVFSKFLEMQDQFEKSHPHFLGALKERSILVIKYILPHLTAQNKAHLEEGIVSFIDSPAHLLGSHNSLDESDFITTLLATGDAYIACEDSAGNFWGRHLMQKREEFGGTGIVEPPTLTQQYLKLRRTLFTFHQLKDIRHLIAEYCDLISLDSLCSVDKKWSNDAMQVRKSTFPGISVLGRECYNSGFPLAVDNAKIKASEGSTCLQMIEGISLNGLVHIAEQMNIKFLFEPGICNILLNMTADESYSVMLTHSFLKGSNNLPPSSLENFLREQKSEAPTVLELCALCIFTYEKYKKCAFRDTQINWAFSMTSTSYGDRRLILGERLSSIDGRYSLYIGLKRSAEPRTGVIGRWKL